MKPYKSNEPSSSSALSSSGSENIKQGISINVCRFQAKLRKLPREIQEKVAQILSCFHRNRNVYYLVHSLKAILSESEQQLLFPSLRQVIPKSDRPSFDQFTYEEIYSYKATSSSICSVSQQKTIDSGIGSAVQAIADVHSNHDSQSFSKNPSRLSRSASMYELSSQKSQSSRGIPKRFTSSTFGSAVRRKVKAALSRKGSSRKSHSSFSRRYGSEPQLDSLDKSVELSSNKEIAVSSNGKVSTLVKPMRIVLSKKKRCKDFGIVVGGGRENGSAIFVSEVVPNSPAAKAGLSAGDVLVQINDVPLSDLSREAISMMLRLPERVTLYVKPRGANQNVGHEKGLSWTDTRGRKASPPREHPMNSQRRSPSVNSRKSQCKQVSSDERKVTMAVQAGQGVGLVIRGGSEYGLGIYVTGVDNQSAAENAGLKVGDEILEVNNVRMEGASHVEAVNLIRSSRVLFMTVKHVGRIPQACRSPSPHQGANEIVRVRGHTRNDGVSPPNGIKDAFQRRMISTKQQMLLPNMHVKSLPSKGLANISSTMATLEDALLASDVWMTLSDVERRAVRYYVKEYAAGHVTPDALVLSLSELLNDHDKFSLMSAVRECVNGRDLDRFDVLVLRREVEVLKNRHQTPDCSSATQDNKESCGSESSLSAAESLCLSPEAHSTPNDSYKSPDKQPTPPSAAGRSATVSPVRPTTKPPPPPSKTPPVKPKRSTTVGSQSVRTPPSGFTVPAGGQQDTPSEHENVLFAACDENSEERSSSPFTLALEKHRSSHSGRIKVGPKVPTHQRIPSKDFFSPPDSRDGSTRSSSTTRRSLIEPVRDLSLRVKALPKKPTASFNSGSVTSSDSSAHDVDLPAPPSSFLSSSPEEVAQRREPPAVVTLRSTSFAANANDKVTSSWNQRNYPVKVDVHVTPRSTNMVDTPSGQRTQCSLTSFSSQTSLASSGESTASSEVDFKMYPFLRDDVDTQKVVIFRSASTLGLVLEGGAGTKQPLPRVLKVQPGSCSQMCGRLRPGHILHAVNGRSLKGLSHDEAVRLVALAFQERGRDSLELLISGPYD